MNKKSLFDESLEENNLSFGHYYVRLLELAGTMFKWEGLPSTVDERYIELTLLQSGSAVYFRDEVIGDLCLGSIQTGPFDVYGYPIRRRAYSRYNEYTKNLDDTNSVVIWNNFIHTGSLVHIKTFAKRLYVFDRIIDVNVNAQKTPILVQGSKNQRLTLLNLYKEYDGNVPFIFGDKNLDLNSLKAIQTNAPFVADKIYELKSKIWNEALTYLGISNLTVQKKERVLSDEVMRSQGGTIASRYSRLVQRQTAAEKINTMFGTNISVHYREDISENELQMPGDSFLDGEGGRLIE